MSSNDAKPFHANPRATAAEQVLRLAAPLANQRFYPLPAATGKPPYRLKLESLLAQDVLDRIAQRKELTFHCLGDSGGVKSPESQEIVALQMEHDFTDPATTPAFAYHLSDVVYYNGQRADYYDQFYEPYKHYPALILGIPENHDGEPLDEHTEPSLAAFVENFCATTPHVTPEAQETPREAMTQPNVYFTLNSTYATIIGLYTNVPEGGQVDQTQTDWLHQELHDTPRGRALIVAHHHPPSRPTPTTAALPQWPACSTTRSSRPSARPTSS